MDTMHSYPLDSAVRTRDKHVSARIRVYGANPGDRIQGKFPNHFMILKVPFMFLVLYEEMHYLAVSIPDSKVCSGALQSLFPFRG